MVLEWGWGGGGGMMGLDGVKRLGNEVDRRGVYVTYRGIFHT